MVQLRRLDPLANAAPYQRLLKTPVKSFTLTEAQYKRVKEHRPELMVTEGEAAVIGRPYADRLELHYGFPELETFRARFGDMFARVIAASSKAEAPRGLVLAFRDRPNRATAETVFWLLALDQGRQWVEMNLFSLPEQPEPADEAGAGFRLRAATGADDAALIALEAEANGAEPLTAAVLASVREDAKLFRVVVDGAGNPAGLLVVRSEPNGWGVIEQAVIAPAHREALRRPLLEWSLAWLRNNGVRRVRRTAGIDDSQELAARRAAGFTPGETGVDFTRPVDPAEVRQKVSERQAHGTLIKFGDWR